MSNPARALARPAPDGSTPVMVDNRCDVRGLSVRGTDRSLTEQSPAPWWSRMVPALRMICSLGQHAILPAVPL